jgi:hypothetical protein
MYISFKNAQFRLHDSMHAILACLILWIFSQMATNLKQNTRISLRLPDNFIFNLRIEVYVGALKLFAQYKQSVRALWIYQA